MARSELQPHTEFTLLLFICLLCNSASEYRPAEYLPIIINATVAASIPMPQFKRRYPKGYFLTFPALPWINRAEYFMYPDRSRYNDIPSAVYGQFFLNDSLNLFVHENVYVRLNGSERLQFEVTFNTSTDGGIYFYDKEFDIDVRDYSLAVNSTNSSRI